MRKSLYVKDMFEAIAQKYDLINSLISLGKHKRVKKQAVKNVPLKEGAKVLDLCTGTGDIAILISELFDKKIELTAADFSQNMLEIARKRAKNHENISFLEADALNLPFEDETFDAVFISFGLRNLEDLNKGIEEMKRVTKTGGFVINLDTGKPKGIIKPFFRFYFFNIVPVIGKLFSKNFSAYKYLPESADEFPSQEELVERFKKAGFGEVKNYNFVFGAIAQQVAQK